jgi:prepilin-type N-terminal cleavage/methylation domain-containing protein
MQQRLPTGEGGFTIIELIVVIVIIGILSSAGMVGIRRTRAQAFAAVMKSDLRSISIAQEAYYQVQSANGKVDAYAPTMADLAIVLSNGTTVEIRGDADGWAARTKHPGAVGRRCALFQGSAAPYAPATNVGQMTCD